MRPNYNTSSLWNYLMGLIYLVLVLLLLSFSYLILEDSILEYLDRPKYDSEQLAELTKNRTKQRAIEKEENWDLVENGIHVKTGLKSDKNLKLVIAKCTSCHSAKLITQNRATREGWKNMIVWMEATQGLPNLGSEEPLVLDYLSTHYAPEESGRRANLDMNKIEWYILNL